jgi:hypothetical protein
MLTIVITLYNKTGGVLMAMLIIFLDEFNYEFNNGILYEGFEPSIDENSLENSTADSSLNKKQKNTDQLTVAEQLKSRPS